LEKECSLPGVFCDSGDTPANLLCELNGHLVPCTSCLYGKWVEDVCTGQSGVFVCLVLIIIDVLVQRAVGAVATEGRGSLSQGRGSVADGRQVEVARCKFVSFRLRLTLYIRFCGNVII